MTPIEDLKQLRIVMVYYLNLEDLSQIKEMVDEAYEILKDEAEQASIED